MYFSYVPSIIFFSISGVFFSSMSPFSQSSFQTDPNSILFIRVLRSDGVVHKADKRREDAEPREDREEEDEREVRRGVEVDGVVRAADREDLENEVGRGNPLPVPLEEPGGLVASAGPSIIRALARP